jgi:hypothetical protein
MLAIGSAVLRFVMGNFIYFDLVLSWISNQITDHLFGRRIFNRHNTGFLVFMPKCIAGLYLHLHWGEGHTRSLSANQKNKSLAQQNQSFLMSRCHDCAMSNELLKELILLFLLTQCQWVVSVGQIVRSSSLKFEPLRLEWKHWSFNPRFFWHQTHLPSYSVPLV